MEFGLVVLGAVDGGFEGWGVEMGRMAFISVPSALACALYVLVVNVISS
jgi:hypothetical protein